MKKIVLLLIFLFIFSYQPAIASDNSTTSNNQNKKTVLMEDTKTPICIDYTDTDKLGRVFGLRLEEKITTSNLFTLIKDKGKCFKISIKSKKEFNNTPLFRSIVSVVWTFFYGEDVLSSFLDQDVIILDPNAIDLEADNVLALTRNILKEYNYLLQ